MDKKKELQSRVKSKSNFTRVIRKRDYNLESSGITGQEEDEEERGMQRTTLCLRDIKIKGNVGKFTRR